MWSLGGSCRTVWGDPACVPSVWGARWKVPFSVATHLGIQALVCYFHQIQRWQIHSRNFGSLLPPGLSQRG